MERMATATGAARCLGNDSTNACVRVAALNPGRVGSAAFAAGLRCRCNSTWTSYPVHQLLRLGKVLPALCADGQMILDVVTSLRAKSAVDVSRDVELSHVPSISV